MRIISRSLKRNKLPLRQKKIWTGIMATIILVCSCFGIFYSHRYFRFDLEMFVLLVGAGAVMCLDLIWFAQWGRNKFVSVMFGVLIGAPILAGVIYLHRIYIDSVYKGHEVQAKGIVTKLFVRRGRGGGTPYAIFTYAFKGKQWTQKTINSYPKLVVGDTVKLWCSAIDPTVFVRITD